MFNIYAFMFNHEQLYLHIHIITAHYLFRLQWWVFGKLTNRYHIKYFICACFVVTAVINGPRVANWNYYLNIKLIINSIMGNFGILLGIMNMQLFASHYRITMQFQIYIHSQSLNVFVKYSYLKINGAYQ